MLENPPYDALGNLVNLVKLAKLVNLVKFAKFDKRGNISELLTFML